MIRKLASFVKRCKVMVFICTISKFIKIFSSRFSFALKQGIIVLKTTNTQPFSQTGRLVSD